VHDTTKHLTSPFSDTLPPKVRMQRSRLETSFVSSLTARNTKTRWPSLTSDDRSVHHSATPSASRRLYRRWSRILWRPITPSGWLSQWLICFPGPRVPLRTVHVAILCWPHRLPMTERIISPLASSCKLVFGEEAKWSSSVATWQVMPRHVPYHALRFKWRCAFLP